MYIKIEISITTAYPSPYYFIIRHINYLHAKKKLILQYHTSNQIYAKYKNVSIHASPY